ncbi:hypothetical protein PhCBS80983_g01024 [Powellomyces hirtus]|uniref:Cysteine-rich PDZ-binding protein n=1 Tax=Powellomyces hirtus TaxID=109895 RepID=A0A507EBL7_9FUNG|nr:hypothetical protein PhCBS80983_g01024 [Powellomyces hirtus]
MVCKKCEKKLSTLATSDPFAKQNSGSSSKPGSSSSTSSSTASTTARKINENKLLSSKAKLSSMKGMGSNKFMPYETKCKVCKQRVHQHGSRYCQQCAYKNGICAMCGVQILDTSGYKMASKKPSTVSALPQEILDYIFLWYADPSVTAQLGGRYVRSKLNCANAWNPYHQCNKMCRISAVLKMRHGDVCADRLGDYYRAAYGNALQKRYVKN